MPFTEQIHTIYVLAVQNQITSINRVIASSQKIISVPTQKRRAKCSGGMYVCVISVVDYLGFRVETTSGRLLSTWGQRKEEALLDRGFVGRI